MTDRPALKLMSTSGCSLCEQALDLLISMPELAGWQLRVVDVTRLENGVEHYGERLPVLVCGNRELDGPLSRDTVRIWLRGLASS